MKKTLTSLLTILLLLFILTGCSGYSSHYSAIGYFYLSSSSSARASFTELKGTVVLKMKCKSDNQASIEYSGSIKTGSLKVYYDCGGAKKLLFSLQSGNEVESTLSSIPKGTVYIIIETSERCYNGNFDFKIVY